MEGVGGLGSAREGGAFARLMSRCQVVDSHTHKVTQPTAPVQPEASSASAEKHEKVKISEPELKKPDIQSVMRMDALLDSLEDGGEVEALDAPAPSSVATSVLTDSDTIRVSNSFPPENKVGVNKVKDDEGGLALNVKVEALQEVVNLTDGTVDLQVSSSAVSLSITPTKKLKVTGGFTLDPDTTKASFSKRKKTLTIKVALK